MNATAYFIHDRALSLVYEARRYPETINTILAWFSLAEDCAKKRGLKRLVEELRSMQSRIVGDNDTDGPLPMWAGETRRASVHCARGEITKPPG